MSGLAPAFATTHLNGPHVDFAGLSPLIALLGGAVVVLLVGLLGSRWVRAQLVPTLSLVALGSALGLTIWQWNAEKSIVSGALRIDDLSLALNLILIAGGACTVLLAWRSRAAHEAAHGEFHALLLTSVGGMSVLASAQNTTMFAARAIRRLHRTGRSRRRVAFHCNSNKRRRRALNRSTVQLPSPNRRSSLAAGGSTARR